MKAIIFDVDGVLINSKDESGAFLWQKNIKTDLGLDPEQMRKLFSGNWASVMKGKLDAKVHFKAIFAELNISLPVEKFIEYWLEKDFNINLELLAEIETIKGQKLYIATNQENLRTEILEKKFEPYFDEIFVSYKIGTMKPEPEYFKHIESMLNLEPKDIVFIDDSKSFVEAAERLGWTCHHYQGLEGFRHFIKNI